MKIGFCQMDVKHSDIETNLRTIETMLKDCDARIMVLPELALTGYSFESRDQIVPMSSQTQLNLIVSRLMPLAKKNDCAIVFGHSENDGNKLYNTVYVVDETGLSGKHRKLNLTVNETIFDAGDAIQVINVKGIKLGIAVCFETWFPEMTRTLADQGADLIVAPANFGGPWTLDVVKVRALENSIPLIMCNRIGMEIINGEKEYFRGESMIVDGYGSAVLRAGEEPFVGIYDMDLKAFSRDRSLICHAMQEERAKYTK